MKALLDTNVILDALLARNPWHHAAADLLRAGAAGAVELCLTATSVTDVFYIARKNLGDPGAARQRVGALLQAVTVLDVSGADCRAAVTSQVKDYEDAVQAACAARHRLAWIVTRDQRFEGGAVATVEPSALLAILQRPGRVPEA
jgi:predicted nucleic acid-binding protein